MNMGKFERAILDFDRAIRLDPQLASAFYNRGLAKQAKGAFAEGEGDIAEASRLDPHFGKIPRAGWFTVVLQYLQHNRPILFFFTRLAVILIILISLVLLSIIFDSYLNKRFVKISNFRNWIEKPFTSRFTPQQTIAEHVKTSRS